MSGEDKHCQHEREFGEIKAERRRTDEHIEATWKKIDRFTDAISDLKIVIEKQAAQSADTMGIALDIKTTITRVHERIDETDKSLKDHKINHCQKCGLIEFTKTMEPLKPVAVAVGKVRDNILIVIVIVLIVVVFAVIFKIPIHKAIEHAQTSGIKP